MSQIEVEKKFHPNEEQLKKLLEGADFLGEKIIHDIYYDYPDFRLIKSRNRFRNRNGSFELKLWNKLGGDREIENADEIKKYFKIKLSLEEFIEENLIKLMEYKTKRKKYKHGDFIIDKDELTSYDSEKPNDPGKFIFDVCEIELLVKSESEISDTVRKIDDFASQYGLEREKSTKKEEYLRKIKPEIYQKIFGSK